MKNGSIHAKVRVICSFQLDLNKCLFANSDKRKQFKSILRGLISINSQQRYVLNSEINQISNFFLSIGVIFAKHTTNFHDCNASPKQFFRKCFAIKLKYLSGMFCCLSRKIFQKFWRQLSSRGTRRRVEVM